MEGTVSRTQVFGQVKQFQDGKEYVKKVENLHSTSRTNPNKGKVTKMV
jgi:hypothetical protein